MIIQKVNRNDAERVFLAITNRTGGALSAGYHVCFNLRNVNSANGVDVEKPATSALPAYAGVVTDTDTTDTTYSIADNEVGLVQAFGFHPGAFIRHESNGGDLSAGDVFGPVNAQWYVHSGGTAFEFGPIVIMSELAANTIEARCPVFIRAL